MKIIKKMEFDYPSYLTNKWDKDNFKPLKDLKVSIALDDGNIIEAAVFLLNIDGKIEKHACISTQVGCKFGCQFCSSGKNGFKRSLTKKEILEEINLLCDMENSKVLDRLVFMGIGEPMDNYDNVIESIKELVNLNSWYKNKISLATNGVSERLEQLADENLPLDMIWISLHAPTNKKRSELMPVNEQYPIESVLKSAKIYAKKTKKIVWLNYLLYNGFNNTSEDIKNLFLILNGNEKYFGLIITEPNNDYKNYRRGEYEDLVRFEQMLISMGLKNKIVRFVTAGKEVGAGCGEFIFTPIN